MERRNIFSEKALQHAGKNERTDFLPDIRSGWRWFFLTALSLSLGALVYWGFFGTMVNSVPGIGIAMRADGLGVIRASGAGVIEQLNIKAGTKVEKEQVVGQIYNPELFFRVKSLQADYDYLGKQIKELKEGQEGLLKEKMVAYKDYRDKLDELVQKLVLNRERAQHMSDIYARLLQSRSVALIDHYSALERTLENDSSVTKLVLQAAEYQLAQKDILWNFKQKELDMERQLYVKKQELDLAQKLFSDNTWISTQEEGVVTELLKKTGDAVTPGTRIALVSSSTPSNIQVVAYVSAKDAQKVRPGMGAYFAPSSFKPEEYGYLRGIVMQVGDYAGNSESVAVELQNDDFARLIAQGGPAVRVVIDFIPTRETRSGLKWTSKKGADAVLTAGTMGTLRINAEYRAPVSYVIPYLRKTLFGISEELIEPKQ